MYKGYAFLALHPGLIPVIVLAVVWTTVWKGIALWKAGRRNELGWFIALLLLNTLGILEIIYIFAIANRPKA